jgi:hypothetical protein
MSSCGCYLTRPDAIVSGSLGIGPVTLRVSFLGAYAPQGPRYSVSVLSRRQFCRLSWPGREECRRVRVDPDGKYYFLFHSNQLARLSEIPEFNERSGRRTLRVYNVNVLLDTQFVYIRSFQVCRLTQGRQRCDVSGRSAPARARS